ncbi:TniQ family protein [uncultured Roseobacter sp.]|uniref:TniQ family protein n=1 Tax=uncultured Roseobacter sp. TaxID=114847 RepID=UPI0026309040|nr:TniQ family protein [uncultured Roseobacter sp.]
MTRLALTVPLIPFETTASYVSRLARKNMTVPREFCSDMGMRWPHICSSHQIQLERLSEISGAPLDDIVGASAKLVSPCRYQVGRSFATSGTFRRAITRVCPRCIVEAVESDGPCGAFQQLDWLLLCLGVCRKHHTPLIHLPNADHAHKTYDVVQRVQTHIDEVREADLASDQVAPTRFENYVADRALIGPKDDWLVPLDLTDLHQASLTLGMTMAYGTSRLVSDLDPRETRAAMNAGFGVLVQGSEVLLQTLDRLRQNYRTERPYFSKDMGPFYVWLNSSKDKPNLDHLRRCVELFVLDRYPLQVGKAVLNSKMEVPRHLTLNQVRKRHGIGHVRVRGVLAHLNGEDAKDLRRQMDISHLDLQRVLGFWSELQDLKSTADELNVSAQQVKSLIDAGVLEAQTFGTSLRFVTKSSARRLSAKVLSLPEAQPSLHILPLKQYCRFERVPLFRIVTDWSEGRLSMVLRDPKVGGLQGLLIDRGIAFRRSDMVLVGDMTLAEAARYLRISIISIRKLRDAGLLEQVTRRNRDTNFQKSYISRESIVNFESRYLTLGPVAF